MQQQQQNPQLGVTSSNAGASSQAVSDVDIDHAEDCVEHFGKCSVDDLEEMRNTLHSERLKNFLIGNVGIRNPTGPEQELGLRLLEEDLDLQLSLLKDEMPRSTLLDAPEPKQVSLQPSAAGSTAVEKTSGPAIEPMAKEGKKMAIELLELTSGLGEAAAICAAVALVSFGPQLL